MGNRRRMDSAVTLLPQPDSPNRPTVSLAPTLNDTPSTGATRLPWLRNSTLRLVTSSMVRLFLTVQLRIEYFPHAIAKQIEAQHHGEDRHARPQGQRRIGIQIGLGNMQHGAPTRIFRLGSQAEVGQTRFRDDG